MLTSVHVADIGARGPVWRPPKPSSVPGLAAGHGGFVARLSASARKPSLEPGRVVLVAMWESESSLSSFLATSDFGDGWTARCEPLRASGSFSTAMPELPTDREGQPDGPIIVVGHAKANLSKSANIYKFLAEGSGTMLMSDSLSWGCSYLGLPYLGSVTMWRSAEAMLSAVYRTRSGFGNATAPLSNEVDETDFADPAFGEGGHRGAMTAGQHQGFFAESGYVRLRPLQLTGSVSGRDPLDSKVFG